MEKSQERAEHEDHILKATVKVKNALQKLIDLEAEMMLKGGHFIGAGTADQIVWAASLLESIVEGALE